MPPASPSNAAPPAGAGAPGPWLVADLGGTNGRFGWVAAAGHPVQAVQTLPVAQYPRLEDAARAYLAGLAAQQGVAWQPPRWAALAVATAVVGDEVAFTNSPWRFSQQALQAALGLQGLRVLNDFEALALSLPGLGPAQWRAVGAPPAPGAGTLAVVGPGTGLGVGGVTPTAQGWVALPGEGGHVTLAPADDLESALLAQVRRQYAHVSAERLLSGSGLPVLHQALGQVLGQAVTQPWAPEAIVQQGLAEDAAGLCSRSLELFCALLGGVAGNLALTLGARGGVFIGGGIVPRLGARFDSSAFRERFEAKGRFRPYLQGIPTLVITDTLAALGGAAQALAQQQGSAGAHL